MGQNRGRFYCLAGLLVFRHSCRSLFGHDVVDRTPHAGIVIKQEHALVGAGNQSAVGSLLQREHIASAKARALLLPALSAVAGGENSTELAIVHDSHQHRAGVVFVRQNRADITVSVAVIGGFETLRSVIAGQNPTAIGRQQHTVGVSRIH